MRWMSAVWIKVNIGRSVCRMIMSQVLCMRGIMLETFYRVASFAFYLPTKNSRSRTMAKVSRAQYFSSWSWISALRSGVVSGLMASW